MKIMIYSLIIFAAIFCLITAANAQESGKRFADLNIETIRLAMMGGGGMMGSGGMMNGQGILNGNDWPQRDTRAPRNEHQRDPNLNNQRINREEIQRLQEKVQQKRKELSSLYRSGTADQAEINKKIDELNDLERDLDSKISSYDNR